MEGDEDECPNDSFEKGAVVGGTDAGVEPHAVMVEFGYAFVAVFAVHGWYVDVGLAYPAVFRFFRVRVRVRISSSVGRRGNIVRMR